ncbi:hypothetical protein L6164_001269 [Bauhinia variegata]|uniref:Uncharacterized protein n=1 Tax=Bauhinia variegata TaxID=167791 RepID=A0ACB9Q8I3_BAUVA|nr:hypothetical protein L6164_001269 [Bauhinia variegata]
MPCAVWLTRTKVTTWTEMTVRTRSVSRRWLLKFERYLIEDICSWLGFCCDLFRMKIILEEMTDIPMNVTTNIIQRLVDRAIDETYYLCCFKKIVEDFEEEKKTLEAKYTDVQEDIEENKNAVMDIVQEVNLWKNRAEDLIAEDTNTRKSCLFPWCYNCIWQYRQGKDLAKKTQKIKELVESGKYFTKYGRPAELPSWEFYASPDFMFFDSRKSVYDKVLVALKSGENYMIALHGTGGSGKTTLAVKVGEIVEKEKHFDRAVMVTVSNNPNVKMIQDQIAKPLGVEFEPEENDLDRAKKLWSRLTNGERVLILLDDVWEKLKFEDIGIPFAHNHKGCCILITTRDLNVCRQMGCRGSIIKLDILPENEAWIFFQKHSGINDISPKKLKDTAEKIAKECKGLPVALAALAGTLKDQNLEDWKAALRSLKNPRPVDITDHELKEVYQRLKVSYDFLNNEHAQKLFKLCSLFPEDYEIPVEDLTRFSIGLGLFGEIDSYTTARDDMHRAKKKLVDCCLLMEVDERKCVKMHDLIRDVAKVIANNEIHSIVGPKWNQSDVENLGDIRYLYCHNMINFLEQLPYPKLEILIASIETKERDSIEVPEAFFKGMTNLKVLSLQVNGWRRKIIELPQSIDLLEGIRTLRLRNSKFEDISVLIKLQRLETLELIKCFIHEFPNGITELNKLRLLKLEGCEINRNPLGVIGKPSKIEELYFVGNFGSSWEFTGELVASLFDEDNISQKLQRYRISLENAPNDFKCFKMADSVSKGVGVEQFFLESISNATIKRMIQKAECLCLKNIQRGYKSFFPNLVEAIGDMNGLTELQLETHSGMECLIDTASLPSLTKTVFSKLTNLKLEQIKDMKELCQGHQIPSNLFEKLQQVFILDCRELHGMLMARNLNLSQLESLNVKACPSLTSLFTFSTAKSLVKLKWLTIQECMELKHIINEDIEEGEEIVWDQNEDQILPPVLNQVTLINLPNLISIFLESDYLTSPSLKKLSPESSHKARQQENNTSLGIQIPSSKLLCSAQCLKKQSLAPWRIKQMFINGCPKLKSLFTVLVASTMMLEQLDIQNCDGLKQIITDGEDYQNHRNDSYIFPKLKRVYVYNCSLLEFIFPAYFSGNLLHLSSVSILFTPMLKYVFGQYHHEHDSSHLNNNQDVQIDLPALESLDLLYLPKIISICQNNFHATWPRLKYLFLDDCPSSSITSISDFMGHYNTRQLDNKTRKDLRETLKYLVNLYFYQGVNVPYRVVQDCSKLNLTSTTTLEEMKKYKDVQNETVTSFLKYTLPKLIIKFNNEMVGQCAQEDCGSKKAAVAVTSTDSKPGNPMTEPKQTIEASPQILKETQKKIVQSSPASEEPALITSLTASQEIEIETPQEIDELVHGESRKYTSISGKQLIKENFQVDLTQEMDTTVASSSHSDPQVIKETEKDILQNCPAPDKPAIATSSTKSPSTSIISDETIKQTMDREGLKPTKAILEELSTQELDEQRSRSEPFSTNQHQPLEVSQTDNTASNIVVEEPLDSALKIAISEKSTTLAVSTDFKPKNSTAESLTFPTEKAYAEVAKSSEKPAMTTSSAPPSSSAILLQDTTSLSVREIFQGELPTEKDELVTKETGEDILQNLPALDKPAMATSSTSSPSTSITSNEVIEATVVTPPIDLEPEKPSGKSLVFPLVIKETKKEILQNRQATEKPAMPTSSTTAPGPSALLLQKTISLVVEEQVDSALSTDFKPRNSTAESFVSPTGEAYSKDDDLFKLLQSMEDDADVMQPALEDGLVVEALFDLEAFLKMPLKDIANSEANSLRLENAINFLSRSCNEEGSLLAGLKDRIDSICRDVLNHLSSFKQASASLDEFKLLKEKEKSIKEELPLRKEVASNLFSNISRTKNSMAEARQKEADLKEQISKLQLELKAVKKDILDYEANLSSLEQQKEKLHTEVKTFKEEFEFVKKSKSEKVGNQRKAQQKLLKLDSEWSTLYNQFQQIRTAAANQS